MRALTVATVAVALAGYAVILIAARALEPASYEVFMVYWGLFFSLTGFLDGLLQETARTVTASTQPVGIRPFRITGLIALAAGILAAGTSPWWVPFVVPTAQLWGGFLLTVGLAAYAFQATLAGLISAAGRWGSFAVLVSVDSGIRVLLAFVAWKLGFTLVAFLLVTVVGACTWVAVIALSPACRALLQQRTEATAFSFLQRCLKAMVASGANAAIITGFPVILTFTTGADVAAGALAATITAVTVTRAPIVVPMQRFQPALIVHFTKNRHHVLNALLPPAAVVIVVAAAGGAAAWLVGQPILAWFFGEELLVSPEALAALTVASGSTALLMISGAAALAADRHSLYVAGWILATVVALALLSLQLSPPARSALALGVAPLAGVALHLAGLRLRTRVPSREEFLGKKGGDDECQDGHYCAKTQHDGVGKPLA